MASQTSGTRRKLMMFILFLSLVFAGFFVTYRASAEHFSSLAHVLDSSLVDPVVVAPEVVPISSVQHDQILIPPTPGTKVKIPTQDTTRSSAVILPTTVAKQQYQAPVSSAKITPTPKTKPLVKVVSSSTKLVSTDQISKQGRDVVVGMAQNCDPKNFVVFCDSVRRVASNVSVVLFVNDPVPQLLQEIATTYDIKLIPFTLSSLTPSFLQKYHPSSLRWLLIHNYLEESSGLYDRVWLIDVRDSTFQMNPFQFTPPAPSSFFYVFTGVESITLSQCGWNGGWVKDCFGNEMLHSIGHKPIICSGVSVGSIDIVLKYVKLMSTILEGEKLPTHPQLNVHKFPNCERNGVDQGIHNVLVHTRSIPSMKIFDQKSGPVSNLQAKVSQVRKQSAIQQKHLVALQYGGLFDPVVGSKSLGVVSKKEPLLVVNREQKPVHVLHQYDRDASLQSYLFRKYVYWVDTDNLAEEWSRDLYCSNNQYSYLEDRELFKAKCDLKNQGGATSAASCCKMCTDVSGCKSFTFLGGKCFLKTCTVKSKASVANAGQKMPGAVAGWRTS